MARQHDTLKSLNKVGKRKNGCLTKVRGEAKTKQETR